MIARTGQAVLARLVESQIWQLPASMALLGEGSEKEQSLLPAFVSETKLSTSSRLDAKHFRSSLYAPDAFQAATPVLEVSGSESE